MSHPARIVPSSQGPVRLRAEADGDAPFLFQLFAERAGEVLRAGGVPEAVAAPLVAMQHRARTAAYRSAFPHGRYLVAEMDGAPIGRLVEADEAAGVYVVDIALLAEWRGRGIGRALVADLQARQAAAGGGVRAHVAIFNTASLRMFDALGFRRAEADGGADVELFWSASVALHATGELGSRRPWP